MSTGRPHALTVWPAGRRSSRRKGGGRMPYAYPYPRPSVTVDVVLVRPGESGPDGGAEVLLIRRAHEPFAGMWALPGGFVDENEDLPDAARRELEEETAVVAGPLTQVGAFGKAGRDPRGWTVGVAYTALVSREGAVARAGDDAAEAAWFPLDSPPPLAFDHAEILAAARQRLSPQRAQSTQSEEKAEG